MHIPDLAINAVSIILIIGFGSVLILLAKKSALLKDQLVPQIPPAQQTFSLAKSQMAFWFVIIFGSFLFFLGRFLFLKGMSDPLMDPSIVTQQTLVLMGISTATWAGGAAVDNAQDTPEDTLNDGLQALGLTSYQDVQLLEQQIAALRSQKVPLTSAQAADLNDKQLKLKIYKTNTAPFQTQGWFRDMTTDIDGTALHRLQAVVWTALLGAMFLYCIFGTKTWPAFSDNVLALMGISNAGYVGFKYNETQY